MRRCLVLDLDLDYYWAIDREHGAVRGLGAPPPRGVRRAGVVGVCAGRGARARPKLGAGGADRRAGAAAALPAAAPRWCIAINAVRPISHRASTRS